MSNSSRPHGLQPSRLLCPWDFPGKSTAVGCHHLLQPQSQFNPGICWFDYISHFFWKWFEWDSCYFQPKISMNISNEVCRYTNLRGWRCPDWRKNRKRSLGRNNKAILKTNKLKSSSFICSWLYLCMEMMIIPYASMGNSSASTYALHLKSTVRIPFLLLKTLIPARRKHP